MRLEWLSPTLSQSKSPKDEERETSENGKKELKAKKYARELERLHVELVKLQEWIKYKGLKVCVVFEGRDGAGKGGTIKAITERVSPRVFRVVALPAPGVVDAEVLPAGGTGLRCQLTRNYPMHMRLDYAWGRDGDLLYFSVGEAF
jgi:Polyphosphate kinase 2 (PPK2)